MKTNTAPALSVCDKLDSLGATSSANDVRQCIADTTVEITEALAEIERMAPLADNTNTLVSAANANTGIAEARIAELEAIIAKMLADAQG